MIIHVNDRFRVAHEGASGWAIQQARVVRDEARWEGRWWYPTLDVACIALLDKALLSNGEEVGVRGAIEAILGARAEIVAALADRRARSVA